MTMPAPHHSIFTGRMSFLTPNQRCQSTEGNQNAEGSHTYILINYHTTDKAAVTVHSSSRSSYNKSTIQTCIWKLVSNFFGPYGRYLMVKTCWLRGLMYPCRKKHTHKQPALHHLTCSRTTVLQVNLGQLVALLALFLRRFWNRTFEDNCHKYFYRPVAQPTVSLHWRKFKANWGKLKP